MKAFNILSTIGKVLNIIILVIMCILLFSYGMSIGSFGYYYPAMDSVTPFVIYIILSILSLIFSGISRKKAKNDPRNGSSYTMMIVAGVMSLLYFSPFYLIAGIVGLASRKSAPEGERNNGRNNYGTYNDRPAGRGRDYDDRRGYDDRDRRDYDDRDRRGYDDRDRRDYDDRDRRGYDDRDRRDYDDRGRDYDRPARRYDDDEGGRRQDRPQKREKSPTFEFNYDDGAPENKEFNSFDEFGKNDK